MTPQEFTTEMIFLGTAYGKDFSKDQIAVWYEFFRDEKDADFRKAIARIISKSKFLPSIAEIKGEIKDLNNTFLQLQPDDEWEKVIKAIGKYGAYNAEEAVKSLEPFTAMVVRHMGGFRHICMSEETDWLRKDFMRLWGEMKEAKKEPLLYSEPMMTLPELKRMAEIKQSERLMIES